MATRSVALAPPRGWDGFSRSDDVSELAWEVLAGWHYMNPTSQTSVWESPTGATFYLASGPDGALIEVVAGYGAAEDFELQNLVARLRRTFGLVLV